MSGEPIYEPFGHPRATGRLLFDFAVMACCLKGGMEREPVLDFGAGSGWLTEFVARMGYKVTAFDIHGNLEPLIKGRIAADQRIDPTLINFERGDGHVMPFPGQSLGHILCYDTLHHMHDYERVFSEFGRVLKTGGRAIFVEPGAGHSSAPE